VSREGESVIKSSHHGQQGVKLVTTVWGRTETTAEGLLE
jgi:hypothetical protein